MRLWICILVLLVAGSLRGQPMQPHQTAIWVGWSKKIDGFQMPAIGFERSFKRWSSFQMGIGLHPFARPRHPDYSKLNTQFSGEFRYYMLLRRDRRLAGLYMGLYFDMNRTRWYHRNGGIAYRKSWEDAGPSVGYQHAIGPHIRFNEGVTAVIQSNVRDNTYERTGAAPTAVVVYDAWYTYYFYLKMAVVW